MIIYKNDFIDEIRFQNDVIGLLKYKEGSQPPPVEDWEGLTFTATSPNSKIFITETGSPTIPLDLQYTTDGLQWNVYTLNTEILLNNTGDKVVFKRNSPTSTTQFNNSLDNRYYFDGYGSIEISDNINYLIDKEGHENILIGNYCFCGLFYNPDFETDWLENAEDLLLLNTNCSQYCYSYMFKGCTCLMYAPELPATDLSMGYYCYMEMFSNCRELYLHYNYELPAKTLARGCYKNMFNGCEQLIRAPYIKAETIASQSCDGMFENCYYLYEITCYATVIYGTKDWVKNVSPYGTFRCDVDSVWTTGDSGIPTGWTKYNDTKWKGLRFIALEENSTIKITSSATQPGHVLDVEYSLDNITWSEYTKNEVIRLNSFGSRVSFRRHSENPGTIFSGDTSSSSSYYNFEMTGNIKASGSIAWLLNKTYNYEPEYPITTTLTAYAFNSLFRNCTVLTDVSNLIIPYSEPSNYCYYYFFRGCTGLTSVPDGLLPATTLKTGPYYYMFYNCTNLQNAPYLPALTLGSNCYLGMFYNCSSLSYIRVAFITTPGDSYTKNWVYNVSATGEFHKDPTATWQNVYGASAIPTGWTVY